MTSEHIALIEDITFKLDTLSSSFEVRIRKRPFCSIIGTITRTESGRTHSLIPALCGVATRIMSGQNALTRTRELFILIVGRGVCSGGILPSLLLKLTQ